MPNPSNCQQGRGQPEVRAQHKDGSKTEGGMAEGCGVEIKLAGWVSPSNKDEEGKLGAAPKEKSDVKWVGREVPQQVPVNGGWDGMVNLFCW